MTRIFIIILFSLAVKSAIAQHTILGRVLKADSTALPNASILLNGSGKEYTSLTGSDGTFKIDNLPSGEYQITVSHIGYETYRKSFMVDLDKSLLVVLNIINYKWDEVVVNATRSTEKTGLNYNLVINDELEKINNGKDIPFLLSMQPSVVVTSDAGIGVGYTGIRIRGTDASRINVTINGIPVNDAESQNVYWVNMPDLATSVENIQIQRGAGTSTNGVATFGGSVNIKTKNIEENPYGSTSFSYGSFNTIKNNIAAGSGLINNKWFVDTRLSRIKSDGYVDRATSNLQSYYAAGGFVNSKTLVKAVVFSGKEITYQSWYGVPEARIKNDEDGMNAYITRNGLDAEDAANLLNAGRSYNYYLYPTQVDNYRQDHYQLHFSQSIGGHITLNNALHYTKGIGYYEEFKKNEPFAGYNLPAVVSGNDTLAYTNLVRRKWLDNDFYGTTFSLNYLKRKLQLTAGGSWNEYNGKHFGEITWLQYAFNTPQNLRYYNDDALKRDFNFFLKTVYDVTPSLFVFADVQYRNVNYKFTGLDNNGNALPRSEVLHFFNPKAGITFKRTASETSYLTFAVANREPSRDDYVASTPVSRPGHETLYDFEAGYQYQNAKMTGAVNFYWMQYANQLVLTGAVNDVGNYTRSNIKESMRRGMELMLVYKPTGKLEVKGNVTLSENKVTGFSEYLYNYDTGAEDKITYKNSDLAFSPAAVGGLSLTYTLLKDLNIGTMSKYVSRQFLDNTSSNKRKLDAYFVNDLVINYSLSTKWIKRIDLGFYVYNLFNEMYESNGYAYGYVAGSNRVDENFYYPQAGIHFAGMIKVDF